MVRRDLLIGAFLIAAACDKAAIVQSMERLADQTCACPDRACLEKVEREHKEERVIDPKGLSPDDVQSLHAANHRRGACRELIMTGHATP